MRSVKLIRGVLVYAVALHSAFSAVGQVVTEEDTIHPPPIDEELPPPPPIELVEVPTPMVRITGTRVSLRQPIGFVEARNFTGLQRDENTAITVMELAGGSFYTNAATFTPEGFEGKGKPLYQFEETTVDGYPARYGQIRGADGHTTQAVIFGDSTFSVMLVGMNLNSEPGMNWRIKSALYSATYEKELVIDPFADAPFVLDDSGMKFRFASKGGPMFIYSLGGVEKRSHEEEPFLMITSTPCGESYTAESLARKQHDGLVEKGLVVKKLGKGSNKPMNGYDSFAFTCEGTINGQEVALLFQTVVHEDKALLIIGRTPVKDANYLKDFKALVNKLRFR